MVRNYRLSPRIMLLLATGIGALSGSSALAQTAPAASANATQNSASDNGLADIVVTAERRTNDVQHTAASVAVRSGATLREEGKTQLQDILENIPGVVGGASTSAGPVGQSTAGTDSIGNGVTIRGISSNSGVGGGAVSVAPAIAMYVDDVYEGVGGSYDLDRVEVLSGPQGTLYGRSATGGVVAVHTRDPEMDRWGASALVETGNYDLDHFSAAINIPLIDDKLALRIAGDVYHRSGFDSSEGAGEVDSKNVRVKLLATPTDRLRILIGGSLQYNQAGSGGNASYLDPNGNLYWQAAPIGSGQNRFKEIWANIQWNLGFATLTYIPAWRSWYQNAQLVSTGPFPFPIDNDVYTPKDRFFTNEVRLASNNGTRLKWQVGMLSYYNTVANSNAVNFDTIGNPLAFAEEVAKQTSAIGVFGEATWSLTDHWRVTGGIRYDHTTVDVQETYTSGNPFTTLGPVTASLPADQGHLAFNNVTYKLRSEVDLSPHNLLYASWSTGFSPGDVSMTNDVAGNPQALVLNAETLSALEVGSKNRFFDNKLQVNAALYYYHYSGYQTAFIDIDPSANIAFTTLVSPERTFGGELELLYQPERHDRVALNLAYTNARFIESSAYFKEFVYSPQVPWVAPFTADLLYSHSFDLPGGSSIALAAEGRYLSPHAAGTLVAIAADAGGLPLVHVNSVGIANFTVTWTSSDKKITVGAYVRNITNERYALQSQITTDQITTTTPYSYVNANAAVTLYDPRTFGGIVTVNF